MTLTRSKTGNTPRRPDNPGFVETPGRSRRGRKSIAANEAVVHRADGETNGQLDGPADEKPTTNGSANGSANGTASLRAKSPRKRKAKQDHKVDNSGFYEFGGSLGVSAIMIGFPLLMWYMWIGATFYDGKLPLPAKGESVGDFARHLWNLVYVHAFPHLKAWAIYWIFGIFEMACYIYMPFGIYAWGKPLAHLGNKRLPYYCSGVPSFYLTIVLAVALDRCGLFVLDTLIDEFGSIMSVAILSGFIMSFYAYFSAIYRGETHRMTGSPIYDFFMGAELNPRLLKWLDFKMFFEVRIPWFMLFLTSLAACKKQYTQYGYVSGELGFLLMAHWLYANACCKGEELITKTWDMYYEKLGFMLIFWNMAGVPLSYCHCTMYLVNHYPATYRMSRPLLAALYISYLFAYWVWDTANSQKNVFRSEQRGVLPQRKAFPQLPYRKVHNPQTIPVPSGDDLLCDGWYGKARKIHYTCDLWFAFCWGLVTGFNSPFPWFYPVFFFVMIIHRAHRDIERCRERYGKAWEEYERRVPYLFIPYVI